MTKFMQLSEAQMKFVENDWHHAVLTYFDYTPTFEHRYPNEYKDLTHQQIEDIMEEFEVEPPENHWFSQQTELIFAGFKWAFFGYLFYEIYKANR